MKISSCFALVSVLAIFVAGCHSKIESRSQANSPAPSPNSSGGAAAGGRSTSEAISAARDWLKAGHVDEAAAKLAQLQLQGSSFNAQQAKEYREALSDAFDRALEGSQRDDPKAKAALQLLRAAAPH